MLPLATCRNENLVTFDIMASLGSSSDKIYTHGYHRHYPSFFSSQNLDRNSTFRMIEIGFGQGSSVTLWENLFPKADIIWIDYSSDPGDRVHCVPGSKARCQAGTRSRFYFGSQSNISFLRSVIEEECGTLPCLDLIIDDGGHGYQQQLTSFSVLFSQALKPGGIYFIEDIETSYWTHGEQYGDLTIGGRLAKHTPVNTFKRFVDVLNSEFFDNGFVGDVRVGKSVEKMIKSVSFAHNLIAATKKTKTDQELDEYEFNNRSYRFRSRVEGWKFDQEDVQQPTLEENFNKDSTDFNWCVERMNRLPKSTRSRTRYNDDEDAIMFFEDMCRLQGQAIPCKQQRSVHYTPMGGGIGAGFHLLAHAMTFAVSDDRILLEDVRNNWVDLELPKSISLKTYFHPPTPCGSTKLECYLAPINRCEKNNDDIMKVRKSFENLNVWNIDHVMKNKRSGEKAVRAAWYSFRQAQLINGWGSIQEYVPKKYQHRGLLWYKSQMIHWLIQPSIRVSNAVRKLQNKMGLNQLPSNAKIVVMHVRRGDKANDPIIQRQKNGGDSFYIPLSKYINSARKIHSLHFDTNEPLRILIMTESQSVIDETKTFPDIIWYYTTDHKRQIQGNVKITDEIENGNSNGDIEMMIGLRNLFLSVVEGNAFVGSFSSNWSRLVFEMMYAYHGVIPPHESVDLNWYP
jgi:hypothetical protein